MLGILRDGGGKAISILNSIDVDLDDLRRKVEILNPAVLENGSELQYKKPAFDTASRTCPEDHLLEAKLFQNELINTAHLLLCILRNENDPTTKLLTNLNVDYDTVKEQFKVLLSSDSEYLDLPTDSSFPDEKDDEDSGYPKKTHSFLLPRVEIQKIQNPRSGQLWTGCYGPGRARQIGSRCRPRKKN